MLMALLMLVNVLSMYLRPLPSRRWYSNPAANPSTVQFRHWIAVDLAEGLLVALHRQLEAEGLSGAVEGHSGPSPASLAVRVMKAALSAGVGAEAKLVTAACQV